MQGVESVLLYYKYVNLNGQQSKVKDWFTEICRHSIVGRIRIAEDGINVTIGGKHVALEEHITLIRKHPLFGWDIDFKLSRSIGPLNEQATKESGFDTLQIVLCKEVVSLGDKSKCTPEELPQKTGQHLPPAKWHTLLQRAVEDQEPVVLLDARNIYETRIGHFSAEGTQLVDPKLRHFSELPDWLVENAEILAHRKVMMYCTGGVRCERACALLKGMGPAFQDVCQLQGGIQRYIEEFPDGGFFRGKNFVFDERVAVAPDDADAQNVVGSCLRCGKSCDDYSPRLRCRSCRLLVLLCKDCSQVQEDSEILLCELCLDKATQLPPCKPAQRKLRILCLHGFRQTGNSLMRRLRDFAKGINDLADLEFVDAPHALPFLYRPPTEPEMAKPLPKIDASRPRRAWLVEPGTLSCETSSADVRWEVAPEILDSYQFTRQTEGWPSSLECLEDVLATRGPFDGCLGFSQGAAVATALCAHQCLAAARCVKNGVHNLRDPLGKLPDVDNQNPKQITTNLRFAILCSGYPSRVPVHREMISGVGPISLPSLHVFSDGGDDKQISCEESRSLLVDYDCSLRRILSHNRGHYMPADKHSLAVYRRFLQRFL